MSYSINYLIDNSNKNLVEVAKKHLESRLEDFEFFMNYFGYEEEDDFIERLKERIEDESLDLEMIEHEIAKYKEFGDPTQAFYNYGLSFERVLETNKNHSCFGEVCYKYLLSYGGGEDQVRFYACETEYRYKDWHCGVGLDVTSDDVMEWLDRHFNETMQIGENAYDLTDEEQNQIMELELEDESNN